MEQKQIIADFTDKTCVAVYGFDQWDREKEIKIIGLDLPENVEVHFSLQEIGGTAQRVEGTTVDGVTTAKIPQFILEGDGTPAFGTYYRAYAFIYVVDGTSAETVRKIILCIESRPRPEDYIYTPEDVKTWEDHENRISDIEKNSAETIKQAVNDYLKENPIESGTSDAVQYIAQTLTEEQQAQARTNIGAASAEEVSQLSATVNDLKENGTGGGTGTGLTTNSINALLNSFENVAWANENGKTYYNALRDTLLGNVISVTGITLSKSSESIYTGYETTVTAEVIPSNATDKTIIWASSDETVAKIEGSENTVTIEGVSDGSAVITAKTVDGGYIDTFTVTVATAKVTGITLDKTTGEILVGGTYELTATVEPSEAVNNAVTWKSSDDAIATVTPSKDSHTAVVTGIKEGSVTITATTVENGKTATFSLTVIGTELEEVIPTVLIRDVQDHMNYAYLFDDYDSIDVSDKSKIKATSYWRMLAFDCSRASKINIKRYVNSLSWSGITLLYASNQIPNLEQEYISDSTASDTSEIRFPFVKLEATGYTNPNPVAGDIIDVGDYELKDGYKYLVLIEPFNMNSSGASVNLEDYKNEDGYYIGVAYTDNFKVFIVE